MRAILIRDCGTTQYLEADEITIKVHDKEGYAQAQYDTLAECLRMNHPMTITRAGLVKAFGEQSGWAEDRLASLGIVVEPEAPLPTEVGSVIFSKLAMQDLTLDRWGNWRSGGSTYSPEEIGAWEEYRP